MQDVLGWTLVFAVLYSISMTIVYIVSKRRRKQDSADLVRRAEEQAKDVERQKRDHQLNHGRQIFNWLVEELKQHHDFGIRIFKMEDNGGAFSIHIKDAGARLPNIPILQLSYDFVGHEAPYQGHIHYGAYGADILIWVGDHAPKAGLDRHVLREVHEYVEVRRESRQREQERLHEMAVDIRL